MTNGQLEQQQETTNGKGQINNNLIFFKPYVQHSSFFIMIPICHQLPPLWEDMSIYTCFEIFQRIIYGGSKYARISWRGRGQFTKKKKKDPSHQTYPYQNMCVTNTIWGTVKQYYFLPVHERIWRVGGCQ
jgi:hypothetical protein